MMRGSNSHSEEQYKSEQLGSDEADVDSFSEAEELAGSPGRNPEKEGLMNTVLEADTDSIDLGNMVMDSVNNGLSMFTPELVMEKLVNDYREAEEIFGETLVRQLTGYSANYVQKNMNIPEFKRHLEDQVKQNIDGLKDQGVLSKRGELTEEAMELATVVMAVEELDHLTARGLLGQRVHKKRSFSGAKQSVKPLGSEPYRLLSSRQSVKTALRRGRSSLLPDDLRVFERASEGNIEVVYAIDASGSMKGEKLAQAKRAGVALAYEAISRGDKVGLLVFGKEVEQSLAPCNDFSELLGRVARLQAGSETDLASGVRSSTELFASRKADTKHVILLTDALPTVGADPEKAVLEAVGVARGSGVSVSVIGIALDAAGQALAQRIVDVGRGRLTVVADAKGLDVLVLEEYSRMREA